MKWSKLKKRIEERFAEEVRGRIEFFQTRYRNSHDQVGEFWVTIDGDKIHGFGDLNYFKKEHLAFDKVYNDPENKGKMPWEIHEELSESLMNDGLVSTGTFHNLLKQSLNMSIEDLLSSENVLFKFLGVLDQRCGKRRLSKLDADNDHELIQRALKVRMSKGG